MPDSDETPTIDTVRQRLRDLANTGTAQQSQQGKIRALLPEIDAAIAQGIPRATILENLRESGIAMSLPVFSTAIHRAREAAKKQQGRQARGPALAPAPVPVPALDTDPTDPGAAPLTKKQQRERAADQWIKPAHNPIIDRLIEKESKS